MVVPDVRAELLTVLRERAVLRGDFTLTSGARSEYYLDARVVTLSAEGAYLVGHAFWEALRESDIEGVAGMSVGADPIVTAIAVVSAGSSRPLDAIIARKQRKEHGAQRLLEGPWHAGMRVAVVDDTFTTGASALEAAAAVEAEGGVVEGIYALIDREQGARSAIEAAGYSFSSLYTASELMPV